MSSKQTRATKRFYIPTQSRGVLLVTLLVAASTLGLLVSGWRPSRPSQETTRLVYESEQWKNQPGASIRNFRTEFTPSTSTILAINGNDDQPNPAINIGGQYLRFVGDFTIDAAMNNLDASIATFRLYAEPPTIYDEWRREPASIAVRTESKRIVASFWDGTQSEPIKTAAIPREQASQQLLSFRRAGNDLVISINQQPLFTFPAKDLFAKDTLWFGAEEAVDDWQLSSLTIAATNSPISLIDPLSDTPSYRAGLANHINSLRKDFSIGAAVSLYPLVSNIKYHKIATTEFSSVTLENELKPQFIHPSAASYRWQEADLLVDIAHKNSQAIHGHTLVFGEANPRWMRDAEPAQREAIMTEHIDTVVKHFGHSITSWDVVNEPLSDESDHYRNGGNGLRRHLWYEAMGESYINKAFVAAHKADPNAKLYLNDYGLEADGQRWTALLALLQRLKAAGTPINGIGFQAHIYEEGDTVDGTVLRRHFDELAELGLSARVSELDVYGDNPAVQAEQYATVLQACLQATNCTTLTTWGITDRYGSTTTEDSYPAEYGNDLLWDKDFKEKPAYRALLKANKPN